MQQQNADSGYTTPTRAGNAAASTGRLLQVTPSVTPTSSLSSNDTKSTYAGPAARETPNPRGSIAVPAASSTPVGSDGVPASRNSLAALDAVMLRRAHGVIGEAPVARRSLAAHQQHQMFQEPTPRNSFASAASEAAIMPGGRLGPPAPPPPGSEYWQHHKSATLRAMPVQGRAATYPQFHNTAGPPLFHGPPPMQNPLAGNGAYTLRRNSVHDYGAGGNPGAMAAAAAHNGAPYATGSLMRCTTTNSSGTLQRVKRVYI